MSDCLVADMAASFLFVRGRQSRAATASCVEHQHQERVQYRVEQQTLSAHRSVQAECKVHPANKGSRLDWRVRLFEGS
eukprot:1192849-Prorocentrum_minimum.AAC.1